MHTLQITRMYKTCLLIFYLFLFCLNAKPLQSCPTLCDPMDCSPPYSSVHGILQARILEWVAMPSSRGIFPTQGSNPSLLCLLHWQTGSLPPAPPGKPIFFLYYHVHVLYIIYHLQSCYHFIQLAF